MPEQTRIMDILREAKKLAQKCRVLTGKPLGITGEVAEYEVARILGVELTPACGGRLHCRSSDAS